MRLRVLQRLGLLWLGLLALTAGGLMQNQLARDVVVATLNDHQHPGASGGHFMPDGTYMAGPMHGGHGDHQAAAHDGHHGDHSDHHSQGGHTHKGHADCDVCGLVASMAALSVPVLDTIVLPEVFAAPPSAYALGNIHTRALYAPYASRAPPHTHG